MEDDRIRDLFKDFNPGLSPDNRFIENVKSGLNAVEFVRRQNALMHKHNRIAVAIAALVGFVTGVSLTLLFPLVWRYVSTIHIAIPEVDIMIDSRYVVWILSAAASMIIAFNTYEIVIAGLARKEAVGSDYEKQ